MLLAFQTLSAYKTIVFAIETWNHHMQTEELRRAIDKLEVSEKLTLVEEVWNDIARANEQLPLSEWHKRELSKRLLAYDQGRTQTKDFNQVHDALRIKYK